MGAHGESTASARQARRPGGRSVRSASLLLLENLGIAAGYVLLAWLGHILQPPPGRLLLIWPAAGFALAMLRLRGPSRWPGVLLGSLIISLGWISTTSVAAAQVPVAAILTAVARTLATVAGAQLLRKHLGKTIWPHSVRGVAAFVIIAGLIHSALAAVLTWCALLPSGLAAPSPESLREVWVWFLANLTGTLIISPAILAFAAPLKVRSRHSPWETVVLCALYLVIGLLSFEGRRWIGSGTVLIYPITPLLVWAAFRFGARGATLGNLVLAALFAEAMVSGLADPDLKQAFLLHQGRLLVLSLVVLFLAPVVEERWLMQEALEKERRCLEERVARRTRELAHSLSLLHSSLESTADGLLVVDRAGRITAMNQRFAELWRIPSSSLARNTDADALAIAREQVVDPEAFTSQVAHLYEHPDLESADELVLKDGRVFERFSRPQFLGAEIAGRVWSFRDITRRRRAELDRDRLLAEESQARQAAERSFQEAQKALGLRDEFLEIAAHEMKTPLTSMKVQLQQLERLLATEPAGCLPNSRLKPLVAAASRQVRRFQELGEQLLDITRLSLGRLELRYEPLDLREVVLEQLEQHAEAASKARSELRLDCPGPIPGEWDRRRLERIVRNLLSNAIKFGAGSPITVRLEALGNGSSCLQVIDHGIGIDPEDHERIFERLERAVDSRHYGGLGLGLWIARESVEALGGDIRVASEPGKGAVFTIELPRVRLLARALQDRPPPLADPTPA